MLAGDRQVQAFDAASSDFDRLGAHLWGPIGAATVERTAPASGQLVLDACCGTGASAIPTAQRVGPTGRVDAVDRSELLIEELERLATGLPQLQAHVADVTQWRPDRYDLVQAVLGIFFFPDMAAGTEYLVSRARRGGRVGFTIWRQGSMEDAGRHLQAAVARVTGAQVRHRPVHLVDRINRADAFQEWLTSRGLVDVEVSTHELRLTMSDELAWLVVTGSGFVAALANLAEEQIAVVREAYLESLDHSGVTELDATTLIGVGVRPE
jgi:trans-aconitate methyltransferase